VIARLASFASTRIAWVLAAAVCASVALVGLFAIRAVREWERTATLLAERHAQEAADLLALALTRDMRGAQESVLSNPDWTRPMSDGSYDLSGLVASAFARFPYPDLFFAWTGRGSDESVEFFVRADRIPRWLGDVPKEERFPVLVKSAPLAAAPIRARVVKDVDDRRLFSIFDVTIDDVMYQVVARLQYRDGFREEPLVVFGFMVNRSWVREHYFPVVARQVARIASPDSGLVYSMYPDGEQHPASAVPAPMGRRVVPMTFFDPHLIAAAPPPDLLVDNWMLQALLDDDAALKSARTGAGRTLLLVALAGTVFALGLALTLYSVRSHSKLSQLRADFVATVTHELKTPVATIRAAADTLVSGRVSDGEGARRYAQLMVDESKQLTRLLDNLLAYARIADTTEVYSPRPIAVQPLVDHVVRNARSRLEAAGFAVQLDVAPDLPPIEADWTAVCLALDNVVDNAIRYSKDIRSLTISAACSNGAVRIRVADRGIGIPAGELAHVTRRFFRGRGAGPSGSGLGLAIVERIVKDHHGTLSIESAVGSGSTVTIDLPAAADAA
jgi:signal transduction histidine kinase